MAITTLKSPVQDKALILGIESSCDETAASVLSRSADGSIEILSSIIASQDAQHAPFGGVVPEIAARAHMQKLDSIIDRAVTDAGVDYTDLSAIAATSGPGLIGGVIAGLMGAKGLAMSLDVPLIAVNHLEGHALSPKLAGDCAFPYLLLLISGGHTQLLSVKGLGDYTRLGSTVDDAAGEAFDKSAKVMGLGFPGGPRVEQAAKAGDPNAIKLPRPFKGKDHANFSFAGLKTAVARAYEASEMAANKKIRSALIELCEDNNFTFLAPPLKYCTDNAAMIALAGAEHYALGNYDAMDVRARPRWPLDGDSAKTNPASGFGKKGPKS